MTMLEDSLRGMFAEQVQSPPLINDPASVAIRRGRAARRRRTAASSVAAALALLVTVGGIVSLRDISGGNADPGESVIAFNGQPDATPSGPPVEPRPTTDTGVGLDLWATDRLWTTDGRTLPLTGVGRVTRIYRVPTGWVYGGTDGIRFLRTDGSSISLSGNRDRWALNPGGDQLAFVIDTALYVARVSATGLAVRTRVDVPAGISPVAFLDRSVVVTADTGGFDVVDPQRAYRPNWNTDVTAVYGGNGNALRGLVRATGDQPPCVADLVAAGAGLAFQRTGTCGLDLERGTTGDRTTPDGGWLADPRAMEVRLVDLTPTVAGRPEAVACPVRTTVPPAWADSRTLLTADDRGVVRCGTDGTQRVVPLPAGVTAQWQFVPKLITAQPSTG
ncbi:hypothetical protein OG792_30415 [Micromonospora sp. NBC_01699]|uniref:hypothetical protein n=1 Tax=Micromonospora sp. NBC_01699 TaxID=2975984 RepID=UPI002E29F727|nr:hypothetical protein [Micromonospora sp. NBC_01699]